MTGTEIPTDKMSIYLNDHLAMASGAKALADRAADGSANDELKSIATQASQDLATGIQTMRSVMKEADIPVNKAKRVTAVVSERIGRLKFNGSLFSRSPLSDYTEAEGLAAALTFHAALWPTLARHNHVTEEEANNRSSALATRSRELVSALAPEDDR